MIWLTNNSVTGHQWAGRCQDKTLICMQCRLSRPIQAEWLSYPHHCPPRLETA